MEIRQKIKFFCYFGIVFFLSPFAVNPAFSQTPGELGIFAGGKRDIVWDSEGLEDIGTRSEQQDKEYTELDRDLWPESDEAKNQEATDGELELTPREIRGQFKKGLGIALFPTRPWQIMTLSANFLTGTKGMWITSAGGGVNTFEGDKDAWHYQMKTSSNAVDVCYQWFLSDIFPLSFETGLGIVAWRGMINPSGGDYADGSHGDAALRAGFTGTGLYGFAAINLTWIRSSGLYLEYNVVGLGTTRILDLTMTKDTGASRAVVYKNLGGAQTWGFINLKIGWFL